MDISTHGKRSHRITANACINSADAGAAMSASATYAITARMDKVIKAAKRIGEFGERIKTLRASKSLSASDLAKLADITPAAVWQWENNGGKPRRSTLKKLANVLSVPMAALTGEEETDAHHLTAEIEPLSALPLEALIQAIEARGFCVSVERRQP